MDKRFEQIQEIIIQLAKGNYDYKVTPSESLDDIDGLILGINMLGEQLKVYEEKHVALFEHAGDALLIYNTTSNAFCDSNASASVLLGFSKEEIRLLSILDLFPENEKARIKSKITHLKSVIQTSFDIQLETKTRELKDVSFLSKKMPFGEESYFHISLRDISESKRISKDLVKRNIELKKAQKETMEASKLASENPNPILRFNEKFQLIYNNAASTISFLSDYKIKENELNDKILKNLLKKVKLKGTPETFIDSRNEIHYSLTLVYVPEFNYTNVYVSEITDFINQVNKNEKSLISLKDEMEVKVLERTTELSVKEVKLEHSLKKEKERTLELFKSKENLKTSLLKEKELGDLKSSFVSTASHQFRTPLTVIQSNVGLLEMFANSNNKPAFKKLEKVNGRITAAIAKMTELMDNVLVLGKLTSGNIQWSPQEFSLIDFCQKLAGEFNHIETDGRTLNVATHGEPFNVHVDPNLLSHALSNLISNAFKYSSKQKNPELSIHFKPKVLVLSIKDFGIGIPKNELPKLFHPFYRAQNAAEIKGTGLGLSIAKEYIEINKGRIEAQSILGEGSCFEIIFQR